MKQAQATGSRALQRVTLEMSLKPFMSMEQTAIEAVCEEAIKQWLPLIGLADSCSMLLWVADGSEILTWDGDFNKEMEWGRYIGFANEEKFSHLKGKDDPRAAKLYRENPCRITYVDLRFIIEAFKRIADTKFGIRMEVGATFDAGPEFAYSDFKYKLHPEVNIAELGGSSIGLRADYKVICTWSKLHEDKVAYAAYPDGIPEGTPFGQFLGRQCASFLPALGFDYIWFSNGFGFSFFPWTFLGANYDSTTLPLANYEELTSKALSFWEQFKQECPDYRTEVRGTNFGTGMDLAKDLFPLLELYDRKYIEYPPPNSPWGALNFDFGLEVTSYMSRIAVLPKETYLFRFYANDPWFWQNPWWDLYDREPHDIYCPLAVARMNSDGKLENPGIIEILTVDTEKGELNEACAQEVIPHLRKAIEDFPDQPGILTWLYPFREYHEAVAETTENTKAIFFNDWFVRNAVNQGLPLNTVLSTDDFTAMTDDKLRELAATILFTPTSWLHENNIERLIAYIHHGGKVMLYGPALTPELLELLNLKLASGLAGEMEVTITTSGDSCVSTDQPSTLMDHDATISGGFIQEVLADPSDPHTQVRSVAKQDEQERIFALTRALPAWNGGQVSWIRGSLPFQTGIVTDLPIRQEEPYMDASVLARYLLEDFGYSLRQTKQEEATKPALLFIARHDNAFLFTGCRQDTSVSLQMRFPDGVPIIIGQTTRVGPEAASYSLDRTFHDECRVFVDQQEVGAVSCRELSPDPTRKRSSVRAIGVTNLRDAAVTIYPPLEALRAGIVEVKRGDTYLDLTDAAISDSIRLTHISGAIEISW
ncbi:hypothetical protein LOZ80_35075 [Paenibacillus sp. HWE-109]|uniref:hypothetical protein n=1 Tax=Paenibacillus sp. HWE-109 TaxID=1306526 RepID=UPI001EDD32A4|nr:hypothetical protein [Paenibacillus sp. HWE-109]UKS26680.1 hypothetical protein LOZ80_35075 [Paenibacillus sp. HWE-109]